MSELNQNEDDRHDHHFTQTEINVMIIVVLILTVYIKPSLQRVIITMYCTIMQMPL